MSLARRLFAKSGLIFVSRLLGAGLMFAVQAMIARRLGSESLGHYVVAIATMNILAMVLPLGFQTIAAYFAAAYAARGEGLRLRRFFVQTVIQIVLVGAVALVLGPPALRLVAGPEAPALAVWGAIAPSATALALAGLAGAVLTALKRPLTGYLGDTLLRPLIAVSALALVLGQGLSAAAAIPRMLAVQAMGFAAMAAAYLFFSARVVWAEAPGSADTAGEQRQWWFFALPWVLVGLATDFFFDLDLILLSGRLSLQDLAVFGIATRLFALAAFAVAAVYAVVLPDMFEAEAQGQKQEFLARVRSANRVAAVLSGLALIAVPVLAPFILRFLGPVFVQAVVPLTILTVILLVRAVFGPAALVLSLERRPHLPLVAVAAGFAVLLVGNALLVPPFGIVGASLSALLATTSWSAVLWLLARRVTGLDVSIWSAADPDLT